MDTLKKGDRGADVVTLQDALNAAGYPAGTADGIFGPKTEGALLDFQESQGLETTGRADASTWEALNLDHTQASQYPTNELLSGGVFHEVPKMAPMLKNHYHPSVPEFASKPRKDADEIIIHESVTYNMAGAVSTLLRKGYGVQLGVDIDGSITQHGDLATTNMIHAGRHNPRAIGLEVANIYYGDMAKPHHIWKRILSAPWAHKGKYSVPPLTQAEAVHLLIRRLTTSKPERKLAGLHIPRIWHMVDGDRFILGVVDGKRDPSPGIYAHYNTSTHADGCWPALYCWLRMEANLSPGHAWTKACELTEGARGYANISAYT